ncbi:MAG: glycosyltransferase family 4 protein [Bacteroidaceae bacterium]|nr:glycosyltransferase family 4 protein [Bacteroidaceae bacterium]
MHDKIVLINQSTGYLMIDTVNAFCEKSSKVALICGSLSPVERNLCEKVNVDKIVKYNRKSALRRILSWGIGSLQIYLKLLCKYRDYHVVYVTNPPMSYMCSKLLHNSFSIIVYDIYPDALRNVGIKENNLIHRWWKKQNRKLFAKAENVFSLSDGMADSLSAYMPKENIKVVPLWSASEKFVPIDKSCNEFVQKYGLQNKFVVMYSGNMGYTHSVDVLVELASQMKANNQIHFLLIGGGQKKTMLEERVMNEKLTNCTILDWQTQSILPQSLASADLGVVTLNTESAKVSVPSKTFNLMAVGAPLMCISPCESEIHSLIEKYRNGCCFDPSDIEAMKAYIEQLSLDRVLRNELSANSLKASKDFTAANAKMYLTT